MTALVTIDARMAHHSGIGTMIRNVVPRVIASWPEAEFALLVSSSDDPTCWLPAAPSIRIIPWSAGIYSPSEQLTARSVIPRGTSVLWVPHFNAPLTYRGRLVATICDLGHLRVYPFSTHPLQRIVVEVMLRNVLRRAETVFTISAFVQKEIEARFPGTRAPIRVVHLAADPKLAETGNAVQPPVEGPYLLFIGNVKANKNLLRLLQAFASTTAAATHKLVIVGQHSGFRSGAPEVMRAAEALGDRIVLAGRVTDVELASYLAHAEALVFPSTYEGFGLPPLEAMVHGCPVIASSAASIPEVCGDAALYFDPFSVEDMAHAIDTVLESDALRQSLRERGRLRAESFSWDRAAAIVLQDLRAAVPDSHS